MRMFRERVERSGVEVRVRSLFIVGLQVANALLVPGDGEAGCRQG
jgi:hypothetical protein